jgi:hypothetical protein
MMWILWHGLETNPDLQARLDFIASHRTLWTFAWLTWTLASVTILNFYRTFAARHGLSRLAVLMTAAAMAADLSAQSIEMGLLPSLTDRADLFLIVHRVAVLLSGYLANTLYSVSGLILVWPARIAYPVWVWLAGLGTGFFGLTLSVAALADSPGAMFWTNVALVPSLLVWLAGVALHSRRAPDAAERFLRF